MDDVVMLEGVTKSFGSKIAVDGLSLRVPTGSISGFIGPNGSGKSTTLRMIMRILRPDQGRVEVLGGDAGQVDDRVAYLPEERGLYKKMEVGELLRFHTELKGRRLSKVQIAEALEKIGLEITLKTKIEALSKGMAQKVQILANILSEPQLIILDEPFSGLDPVNAEVIRQSVLDLKRDGATVIFSTHDMGIAEQMCDVLVMIYRGQKVLDGTMKEIAQTYGQDTLRVRISQPEGTALGAASLGGLPGVVKVTDYGQLQELRLAPEAEPSAILTDLMRRGHIRHFEQTVPSLHDIFVRIAGPQAGQDLQRDQDPSYQARSEETIHA